MKRFSNVAAIFISLLFSSEDLHVMKPHQFILPPIAENVGVPPILLVQMQAAGPRYLAVTPAFYDQPIAIRVTSPSFPCLLKYSDANGFLVDSPVYQMSGVWGTVYVGDEEIIPSTDYEVVITDSVDESPTASVTTWSWGDATNNSGVVNLDDILCVLGAFGAGGSCGLYASDLIGPDRIIDLDDILAVLGAFSLPTFPGEDPCP